MRIFPVGTPGAGGTLTQIVRRDDEFHEADLCLWNYFGIAGAHGTDFHALLFLRIPLGAWANKTHVGDRL